MSCRVLLHCSRLELSGNPQVWHDISLLFYNRNLAHPLAHVNWLKCIIQSMNCVSTSRHKPKKLIDFHSAAEFSFSTSSALSHRFEFTSPLFISLSVPNDLLICFSHNFHSRFLSIEAIVPWVWAPMRIYAALCVLWRICVHKLMR